MTKNGASFETEACNASPTDRMSSGVALVAVSKGGVASQGVAGFFFPPENEGMSLGKNMKKQQVVSIYTISLQTCDDSDLPWYPKDLEGISKNFHEIFP